MREMTEREVIAAELVREIDQLGLCVSFHGEFIDLSPVEQVPVSLTVGITHYFREVRDILIARNN